MDNIIEKSKYCLNCKVKPCSNKGCPMQNDIPEFIQKIKEENYKEAYKIISKTSVLPGVCGRICPHEKQCQGSCVRGIKGEPEEGEAVTVAAPSADSKTAVATVELDKTKKYTVEFAGIDAATGEAADATSGKWHCSGRQRNTERQIKCQ